MYKAPVGGSEVLVAVKRLRPSILKNKEELLAFVEETKLLRKLQHRSALLLPIIPAMRLHPVMSAVKNKEELLAWLRRASC